MWLKFYFNGYLEYFDLCNICMLDAMKSTKVQSSLTSKLCYCHIISEQLNKSLNSDEVKTSLKTPTTVKNIMTIIIIELMNLITW